MIFGLGLVGRLHWGVELGPGGHNTGGNFLLRGGPNMAQQAFPPYWRWRSGVPKLPMWLPIRALSPHGCDERQLHSDERRPTDF